MRHAFIITAHAFPQQLKRIVKLISAPNHYVIINIDGKVDEKPFIDEMVDIENIIFMGNERIVVNHGGFSQIQATINMLKKAKTLGADYCHFISGQDYPCVSIRIFDDFFEKNKGKSYMQFDLPTQIIAWRKSKYPMRYKRFYFTDLIIGGEELSAQ